MANPPFNQKAWRADNELLDDPRWKGYDVPQTGNANYAWILNMVSKLSDNGVAGFIWQMVHYLVVVRNIKLERSW